MKKKKRKKLKIKSVFIFLLFLAVLYFGFYSLSFIKPTTYIIKNNKYLSDEEVLKELQLDKDSSFLTICNIFKKDEVKKSKLIKSVDIKRNLDFEVIIDVKEYKMLYINKTNNKVVLENNESIKYSNDNLPLLINKIDDKDIMKNFNKKMAKVNDDVINIISEITYAPNGIDKERFLFSMNDGNYVYITITKLTKINNYKKIIDSVENKNGILYLDYGNYFVPKE